MSLPRVDIAITVFGRADYVASAVESVLEQSYGEWGLTISEDGGATEAVARAVAPYLGDARIKLTTPGRRLGNADHKTSLIAQGGGKYVATLDDDDLWKPGWLERRVEFLEEHPACGLVWGGHYDIDGEGNPIGTPPMPFSTGVHSSREFTLAMMEENLVPTPSILYRRETYERAGNAFDPRFVQINDYELWLRLGLLGPVGFLGVRDSCYRLHSHQTSRMYRRAPDHLLLIDHLDGLLAEHAPDLRLDRSVRNRRKAESLLSVALDAAEQEQLKLAAHHIAQAAGLAPRALASRRGAAAVIATVGGRRARRRIAAMRP